MMLTRNGIKLMQISDLPYPLHFVKGDLKQPNTCQSEVYT